MATDSGWIQRSYRATFITRRIAPCCGMSYAWARAWSAVSKVQGRVPGFSNHTRVARRRMQEIQQMTAKERQERQTQKYRELIGVTEEVVNCARKVVERTSKARGKNLVAEMAIHELHKEINHYCKLGDRVIHQARRRVLEGEQVPNAERSIPSLNPTPISSSAARCKRQWSS